MRKDERINRVKERERGLTDKKGTWYEKTKSLISEGEN